MPPSLTAASHGTTPAGDPSRVLGRAPRRSTRAPRRIARPVALLPALVLAVLWILVRPADARPEPSEPFEIAPAPAWVEPIESPASRHAIDRARGGVAVLVLDSQVRLTDGQQWHYVRGVQQVVSEPGVEVAGQLTFEFSAPHQRLVLHEVIVRRNGEAQSRLSRDAVQIVQRERSLEERVYDGRRTAVMVLSDVRVGDVIDFAYSVVGSNPVLDGHFGAWPQLQLGLPVGALHYSFMSDRPLRWRSLAGAPDPIIDRVGDHQRLRWSLHDVEPYPDTPDIPADELRPSAQVSDIAGWDEVARWGGELFATTGPTPASIVEIADEIRAEHASVEARATAAVRFVQDEIRYFAMSFAEGAYRPADPTQVLERRFGDCKDKSLLAVVLLRELGVSARVALVRTMGGSRLPELLPAIGAFDHAIVALTFHGDTYFADVTQTLLRGTLADTTPRGLHHALLLGEEDVDELVVVPERPKVVADVDAEITYRVERWGGPVALEVVTRFGDDTATAIRGIRASLDPDTFAAELLDIVRQTHPDARPDGTALEYVDHGDDSGIVTRQRYTLDPWIVQEDGTSMLRTFPLYARQRLPGLAPDRYEPLALPRPLSLRHHIEIHPPEPIGVERESSEHTSGPVRFSFRAFESRGVVHVIHELDVVASRAEVHELTALQSTYEALERTLTFAVWHNPAAAELGLMTGSGPSWTVAWAAGSWLMLVVVVLIVVHVKQPYLPRSEVSYDPTRVGLRGWLALLALRVVFVPLSLLGQTLATLPTYNQQTWAALTTEGAPDYHALWAPVLLFELCSNLLFVVGGFYLVYAMFARRRSFPLLFIVLQALLIVCSFVDAELASLLPITETMPTGPERLGSALVGAAWIAYVVNSQRVRSTFLGPDPSGT